MNTPGLRLRGTGSCLPGRVFGNDEFPASLGTSDEWIRSRTGIRTRRLCGPGETTASLGLAAARQALAASGLTAAELDLVICATLTPDMLVPATACQIHGALGCRPVPAFDLNAACSGFLYALAVADQFLRTGACRNALVVGADTMSRVVDFADRNTCVLFGDGAGAVVVSGDGPPGLRSFRLFADGGRAELIRLNGVATRPSAAPAGTPTPSHLLDHLRMNGREVFRFAVHTFCCLVRGALDEAGLTAADVDLLIPHQVNQRILDAGLDQLAFPPSKVVVNLDRYGNTSAASVPIALDEAVRAGRARPGDTALLVAFGGGLTWSSALLTL
jgi:3-oxoacyl-[acyl-carrier-protein] synthase-3